MILSKSLNTQFFNSNPFILVVVVPLSPKPLVKSSPLSLTPTTNPPELALSTLLPLFPALKIIDNTETVSFRLSVVTRKELTEPGLKLAVL